MLGGTVTRDPVSRSTAQKQSPHIPYMMIRVNVGDPCGFIEPPVSAKGFGT